MKRKKCCECGEKIIGREHPKYYPGQTTVIPQSRCEKCWNRLGRPAKETVGKLYKHNKKEEIKNDSI